MMLQKISYKIALQFMVVVFLLLLLNGVLFLAIDFHNAQRQVQSRLENSAKAVAQAERFPSLPPRTPPFLRDHIRIVDAQGNSLHSGSFFTDIPFRAEDVYVELQIEGEEYRILTTPVMRRNTLIGYVQVADIQRLRFAELPFRGLLYVLGSFIISLLTFGIGLFFAKRSLRPAEEMLERLEQFTQDASHELRNPLAAVRTSIDLALKQKQNNTHYLKAAKKDLDDIETLVERLLELARLDALILHTEQVHLQEAVQDVFQKHHHLAKQKKITVHHHVSSAAQLSADPFLLRQVIANLLTNAIKFTQEGGSIHIHGTQHAFSISDTGSGIGAEALPQIFNRFYQEDSARSHTQSGTGLGLALVKRICDLHDWLIDVESTKGEGTSFTIRFGKRK